MLDEIDPVDLSHVMWAMARFDSYPAPGLVDAVLATLPPQIASAEPAVSLSSGASAEPAVSLSSGAGFPLISIATDALCYLPMDKRITYMVQYLKSSLLVILARPF